MKKLAIPFLAVVLALFSTAFTIPKIESAPSALQFFEFMGSPGQENVSSLYVAKGQQNPCPIQGLRRCGVYANTNARS